MIQRREEGRSFRNVRVELKDGNVVSTQLVCTDGKQSFHQVANLKTKLGTYPYAKIRASDVILQEIELTDKEISSMFPMGCLQ
eukprot:g6424.t1